LVWALNFLFQFTQFGCLDKLWLRGVLISFCNIIPGISCYERQRFLGKKDNDNERQGFLVPKFTKNCEKWSLRKTMINERLGFPNLERLLQRKTCSAKSSDSCKSSDSVYLIEKDLNVLAVERLGLMKDLLWRWKTSTKDNFFFNERRFFFNERQFFFNERQFFFNERLDSNWGLRKTWWLDERLA